MTSGEITCIPSDVEMDNNSFLIRLYYGFNKRFRAVNSAMAGYRRIKIQLLYEVRTSLSNASSYISHIHIFF